MQFNVTVLPQREGIALNVTQSADAPVGVDDICIRTGTLNGTTRQNEVLSAVEWLADGVRDRNLLDDQFKGAALYTWVDIDRITANGRQTDSTGPLADTADIVLAMGLNVTDTGQLLYIDTAIDVLIDVAMEWYKVNSIAAA